MLDHIQLQAHHCRALHERCFNSGIFGFWGLLILVLRILLLLSNSSGPPADIGCPLTIAMPILQCLFTLLIPEQFLRPCFFLHELASLPNRYHGYRNATLYPMFPKFPPLVALEHLVNNQSLLGLALNPLHFNACMTELWGRLPSLAGFFQPAPNSCIA